MSKKYKERRTKLIEEGQSLLFKSKITSKEPKHLENTLLQPPKNQEHKNKISLQKNKFNSTLCHSQSNWNKRHSGKVKPQL